MNKVNKLICNGDKKNLFSTYIIADACSKSIDKKRKIPSHKELLNKYE